MKLLFKYLSKPSFLLLQVSSLILIVVSNIFAVSIPRLNGELINEYLDNSSISEQIQTQIIVFIGISFVTVFLQLIISSYMSEKVGLRIRDDLIEKITGQDYKFIREKGADKILTNLTSDVLNIKNFLTNGLNLVITSVITILGSVFLMWSISPEITMVIVPILPILAIVFMVIIRSASKLFTQSQEARDMINQSIDENIKASMLVRVFTTEREEEDKFNQRNLNAKNIGDKIINVFSWLIPIINLANYLAVILLLLFVGSFVETGVVDTGDILAFYQYITLFIGPIIVLGFIATSLTQTIVSTKRLSDIFDSNVKFTNGKTQIETIKSLELNQVELKDNSKEHNFSLEDITIRAEKGEKIGIVGETGSGKSIILQMIPRFIEPTAGEIFINGENINELEINTIRSKIGFVLQENFLFNLSVRENILFGRDEVSEEEFQKVVEIAQVDEFIKVLPNKYQTIVGERGTNLSGGQKQRITLARALLGKPDLLILDDSTSKLDITTERKIFDAIKKNYKEMIIIIVSQKIVSIQDCNRIYVIDNGRINSSGTHEELIISSYLYKELELSQTNLTDED